MVMVAAPLSAQMTGAPMAGLPARGRVRRRRPSQRRCARSASISGSISRCRSTRRSATRKGRDGPLGQYFGSKPVVLAFVYYDCPMLCTQILNAMTATLRTHVARRRARISRWCWSASTRARRRRWPRRRRPSTSHATIGAGAAAGWHFLTGDEPAIERAHAGAAGFRYAWDEQTQAVRASGRHHRRRRPTAGWRGISSASSTGRATCAWRWSKRRRARSARRSITLLLYCYHYDPMTGRYGLSSCACCGSPARQPCSRSAVSSSSWSGASDPSERRALSHLSPEAGSHLICGPDTPLFPESASTMASPRGRAVFLSRRPDGVFLDPDRRRDRRLTRSGSAGDRQTAIGARIHGGLALEITWSIIPLFIALVIFAWGAEHLLRDVAAARRDAERLRRRQAVDVEVPASRRTARNQRAARAGRAAP